MLSFLEFLRESDEEIRVNPKTFSLPDLYDDLNRLLFRGKLLQTSEEDSTLHPIPVSWGRTPKGSSGITNGISVAKPGLPKGWLRDRSKRIKPGSIFITINPKGTTRLDVLKGILAHEMIHAWNFVHHEFERNQHGNYFMRKYYEIKRIAPFDVPLTHSSEEGEHGVPKPIGFVTGVRTDGVGMVVLYPPSMMESILLAVVQYFKQVFRMQWVASGVGKSPLANTLPIARRFARSGIRVAARNPMLITPTKIYSSDGNAPPAFQKSPA